MLITLSYRRTSAWYKRSHQSCMIALVRIPIIQSAGREVQHHSTYSSRPIPSYTNDKLKYPSLYLLLPFTKAGSNDNIFNNRDQHGLLLHLLQGILSPRRTLFGINLTWHRISSLPLHPPRSPFFFAPLSAFPRNPLYLHLALYAFPDCFFHLASCCDSDLCFAVSLVL